MKKSVVLLLFFSIVSVNSFSQVHYANFGHINGSVKDVSLFQLNPNNNYSSEQELNLLAWTWQGNFGVVRSLLQFTGLNTIPDNAIILSATLYLYGVNSAGIIPQGNSYYNGSNFPTNQGIIGRVTEYWNENTVTWATQPLFDTSNALIIPSSTLQWNEDYSVSSPELVSMVQEMVSNNNFGFILMLKTEAQYRSRVFASSKHENEKLWPVLQVSYKYCDASFDYCINSSEPNVYSFEAVNTNALNYSWILNGSLVSTDPDYQDYFESGDTNVLCLNVLDSDSLFCEECITIFIPEEIEEKSIYTFHNGKEEIKIPKADAIVIPIIKMSPNPTNGLFTLNVSNVDADIFKKCVIKNPNGEVIMEKSIELNNNTFDLTNYNNGIYLVEVIIENEIVFSDKLIKIN